MNSTAANISWLRRKTLGSRSRYRGKQTVTFSKITRRGAMALISSAALAQAPPAARPADPWPGKKKLLAIADPREWYGHVNYHHDASSHTLATVERLGRESGA